MKLKKEDEGRDVDADDLAKADPGHFELRGYSIYSVRLAIFSSARKEEMREKGRVKSKEKGKGEARRAQNRKREETQRWFHLPGRSARRIRVEDSPCQQIRG